MSFFIDKHNRRKSPIALAAFGVTLVYLAVFGLLYALLAEPLYRSVRFESTELTNAAHSLIIAVLGTAVCSLLFLLRDKRVAPYGFAGLAVVLCMFYAAAFLTEGQARSNLFYLITLYGLFPVLVGNAAAWSVYLKMKRANPALNHRKTLAEELREAVEKEAAKRPQPPARTPEDQPLAEPEDMDIPPEEALFGPEAGRNPRAFRSAQEEAMLLYFDDDEDEEESDH